MNIIWERVLLLILLGYSLYLIVRIIIEWIYHYRFKALCERTAEYIFNVMGHIIAVIGAIRKGKSSLVSGIAHALEHKLMIKARQEIIYTREVLHDIDYNNLDELILSYFIAENNPSHYSTKQIIDLILSEFEDEYLSKQYENHIEKKSYRDLLRKYVISFIRISDGNFIASKLTFHSRNTGKYARQYSPSYSAIKDCFNNKLWPLDHYMVIVNNETSLDGRDSHFATKLAHEDSGVPNFYKTIGHVFEETTFYIGDIQNIIELNSKDRKLSTSIVETKGIRIVGGFPTILKIINFLKDVVRKLEFVYGFLKHIKKKRKIRSIYIEHYMKMPNRFKRINYFLLNIKNKMFSKHILLFDTRFYSRTDDIGKTNTESNKYYDEFNCIFPLKYCWGTFDTHELKFIKDILMENSKVSLRDLEDFSNHESIQNYQTRMTKFVLEKNMNNQDTVNPENTINTFNFDDL